MRTYFLPPARRPDRSPPAARGGLSARSGRRRPPWGCRLGRSLLPLPLRAPPPPRGLPASPRPRPPPLPKESGWSLFLSLSTWLGVRVRVGVRASS